MGTTCPNNSHPYPNQHIPNTYPNQRATNTYPSADVIYTLSLNNGKFYVGRTSNIHRRLSEHKSGKSCEWVNRHGCVGLLDYQDCRTVFDEDVQVKRMMKLHGIDNVRGGSYSAVSLPHYQMLALETEIIHAENRCFKCKALGHYTNACPHNAKVAASCIKCGRNTHTADRCWDIKKK